MHSLASATPFTVPLRTSLLRPIRDRTSHQNCSHCRGRAWYPAAEHVKECCDTHRPLVSHPATVSDFTATLLPPTFSHHVLLLTAWIRLPHQRPTSYNGFLNGSGIYRRPTSCYLLTSRAPVPRFCPTSDLPQRYQATTLTSQRGRAASRANIITTHT